MTMPAAPDQPQARSGPYLRFQEGRAGFAPASDDAHAAAYRRLMSVIGPLPRDKVPEKEIAAAVLRAGRSGFGLPDLVHIEAQALADYRVPGTADRVCAIFFTFHFVKQATP